MAALNWMYDRGGARKDDALKEEYLLGKKVPEAGGGGDFDAVKALQDRLGNVAGSILLGSSRAPNARTNAFAVRMEDPLFVMHRDAAKARAAPLASAASMAPSLLPTSLSTQQRADKAGGERVTTGTHQAEPSQQQQQQSASEHRDRRRRSTSRSRSRSRSGHHRRHHHHHHHRRHDNETGSRDGHDRGHRSVRQYSPEANHTSHNAAEPLDKDRGNSSRNYRGEGGRVRHGDHRRSRSRSQSASPRRYDAEGADAVARSITSHSLSLAPPPPAASPPHSHPSGPSLHPPSGPRKYGLTFPNQNGSQHPVQHAVASVPFAAPAIGPSKAMIESRTATLASLGAGRSGRSAGPSAATAAAAAGGVVFRGDHGAPSFSRAESMTSSAPDDRSARLAAMSASAEAHDQATRVKLAERATRDAVDEAREQRERHRIAAGAHGPVFLSSAAASVMNGAQSIEERVRAARVTSQQLGRGGAFG